MLPFSKSRSFTEMRRWQRFPMATKIPFDGSYPGYAGEYYVIAVISAADDAVSANDYLTAGPVKVIDN